jgi:hypothetical protein
VLLLHPLNSFDEQVFSRNFKRPRELINPLVLLQGSIDPILDVFGTPEEQPFIALLPDDLVAIIDHLECQAHLLVHVRLVHEPIVFQGKFN